MSNSRLRLTGLIAVSILTAFLTSAAPPADFTVESPMDGAKFHLADARGKYVALHFLLKTECPFCLRHTRAYAKQAATLPGVVQVFLKPYSPEEIRKWSADLGEEATRQLTVFRDADATLAKAFEIPDGYHFHGEIVHFPALVLLDPAGKEVFRHVGKDNSDRFSFAQLAAKIAELKPAGAANTARPSSQSTQP